MRANRSHALNLNVLSTVDWFIGVHFVIVLSSLACEKLIFIALRQMP